MNGREFARIHSVLQIPAPFLAHVLRGFDATHRSAALLLKEEVRAPVVFACFDGDRAAGPQTAGLDLLC
ncbi:MAG: hypothetical protein HZB55_02110 [Deltaproteobacteria bacterium]|nr:hypothetical protein [Deltaproteobacteria bacterium]